MDFIIIIMIIVLLWWYWPYIWLWINYYHIISFRWLWTSGIQNCMGSWQEVCKGVLPSKVHNLVYKIWTKRVQMCTSCTLQVWQAWILSWEIEFISQTVSKWYSRSTTGNLCTTWTCTCIREFPSYARPTLVLCSLSSLSRPPSTAAVHIATAVSLRKKKFVNLYHQNV
jgi:hypothetical protein